MSGIPHFYFMPTNFVKDVLDKIIYGTPLNKVFVEAAEAGDTGAMIAALVEGADVNMPEKTPSGSLALISAEENGHQETATALKAYLTHIKR